MTALAPVAPVEEPALHTASVRRRIPWPEYLAIGLLTAVFFAGYAIYSASRYKTYLAAGYDLGIFDQAVRDYAHFHAPIVALKGAGYNVLGDHFHPIIATIAPLYWIWDNACVLLIVQAGLLAASIPVVYRFTRRRTGVGLALIVGASYGAGWAIQSMIDFDFHEVAFAVPLMALAIDALDRRADRQLLIYAGLLLLVREDMGALVFVLGLIRLTTRGYPRRWPAITLILAGGTAWYLATNVIIPAFAQDHHFNYWQYDQLGPNLPAALIDMVVHPGHAIKAFFLPAEKSETLAYLFIPLAFLPLRSRYIWICLPLLAEQFYNSRSNLWGTHFHYSALPWLILVFAMVDGAERLHVLRIRPARYLLALWLIAVPVWMINYDAVTPPSARRLLIDHIAFDTTPEQRSEATAASMIPDNVCVAVDDHLAPHLTRRDYVTLADAQYDTADFIELDFKYNSVGNFGPSASEVWNTASSYGYSVVYFHDSVMLLKSATYNGPSSACAPFGPGKG